MTPKEKAAQLIQDFYEFGDDKIQTKSRVLTCVNEILKTNPTIKGTSYDLLTQIVQTKAYYYQVIDEIKKI